MRRRDLIIGAGGTISAFLSGSLVAQVRQASGPVHVALLPFGSPSNSYDQSLVDAFQQGLREVGLVEGRDIILEILWTTGDPDRTVTEAIKRGAKMLVPTGSSASVAAKRRTSTLPIVFISVGNPVAMGLVESLAHPNSNATGFSDMLADLGAKLVELDRALVGSQSTIKYLWHTAWPDGLNRYQSTEQAARSAGVELRSRGIVNIADIDDAITALKEGGSPTLIVQPSPFTYGQRDRIIAAAASSGMATIFGFPIAARDGALMAYGPDYVDMNRRAPVYVDRIIKGTRPADLPVEQPARIVLVINLKTARRFDIAVPPMLLSRADEVIE